MWGTVGVLLASAVIATCALLMRGRWNARGIPVGRRSAAAAGLAALAGGFGALAAGWAPVVALAVATMLATFTLSALTDTMCGKMPKEAAWFGSGVGVILILLSPLSTLDRISTAFAVAIVAGVPFLVWLAGKGIGLGDVRLLAAGALLTAWWAGPLTPLIGYIIATVLQLLLRLLAPTSIRNRLRLTPEGEPAKYPFGPALATGFTVATVGALTAHFLA